MPDIISIRLTSELEAVLTSHQRSGESLGQTAKRLLEDYDVELPPTTLDDVLEKVEDSRNLIKREIRGCFNAIADNQQSIMNQIESMPHKSSHKKKSFG